MKKLKVETMSRDEAVDAFVDQCSDMKAGDVAETLMDPNVKTGEAWLFDQLCFEDGLLELPDDAWLMEAEDAFLFYVRTNCEPRITERIFAYVAKRHGKKAWGKKGTRR